jgi:hypothetical protein
MTISQFPLPEGGIPTGNTADRPANPVIGDVYYNGQLGLLEIFNGTNFVACSAPAASPTISVADIGTDIAYGSAQGTVTITEGLDGGKATSFIISASTGGYTATTTGTTVNITVGNNASYTFSGQGRNVFGTSVAGASTSATLTTVPQAPTIGTATTSGVTSDVTVTWTLNSTGGKNLSSITITPYLNGTTAQTATTAATTSSTSATIVGLTGGSAYTFKVKTTNANGTGLESSASNSITVPAFITVDYLVVAGGGAGGSHNAGGGGAGGLRSTVTATGGGGSLETALSLSKSTNYTVTVGAGGTGVGDDRGNNGNNSVFSTITATAGGGGGEGAGTKTGKDGGSGGGGGSSNGAGGARTANQGFAGGTCVSGSEDGGAGGGGAGAVGTNMNSTNGTVGGAGVQVNIDAANKYYAGGGGGSGYTGNGGNGGIGGGGGGGTVLGGNEGTGGGSAINSGGNGTKSGSDQGGAGGANTGGGGGGTNRPANGGGAGGSGIVTLRWLTSGNTITVGAGLTADATGTDGSYSYKRITAGSGNVSFS